MKKIVELQEDIDFTKLNKAYLNVIDKYEFKSNEIGFTCRPGSKDRVYDSVGREQVEKCRVFPEFAVEFIDTYFHTIWEKYDCDRLKLFDVDFNEKTTILVGNDGHYIMMPIICHDMHILWPDDSVTKSIKEGQVYIINTKERHFWINLEFKTVIILVVTLSEKSKHNKLLE